MKIINKFLALGLMVLTVSCAVSVEIPKDVTYDYNVNVDLKNLKTYDLRPIPTTVGIEPLMLERIKTAIDTELMFKKLEKTSDNHMRLNQYKLLPLALLIFLLILLYFFQKVP